MLSSNENATLSKSELAARINDTLYSESPSFQRAWSGKPEFDYWLIETTMPSLAKAYRTTCPEADQIFAFLLIQMWVLLVPERSSDVEFLKRFRPHSATIKARAAMSLTVRVPPNWFDRYDSLGELDAGHDAFFKRAGISVVHKRSKNGAATLSWTVKNEADESWADIRRKNARAMLALVRATGFKLRNRKSGAEPAQDDIRQHLEFPDELDFAPPYGPAVFQDLERRLTSLSAPLHYQAVPDIDDETGECLPQERPSQEAEKDEEALRDRVNKGYELLNAYATAEHRGRKKGKKNLHN